MDYETNIMEEIKNLRDIKIKRKGISMKLNVLLLLVIVTFLTGNVAKAEDEFSDDLLGGKGDFEEWKTVLLSSAEGTYIINNKQKGWQLSIDGSDADKCLIPKVFSQFSGKPGIIQRSSEGEGKESKFCMVLRSGMYFGSDRTPVKDGEEFQIQFYVKGAAGINLGVYPMVYGDNKPVFSMESKEGAPAGSDQWVLVTERIKIVGAGAQFAFFRIESNSSQVLIDNLEIRRIIKQ